MESEYGRVVNLREYWRFALVAEYVYNFAKTTLFWKTVSLKTVDRLCRFRHISRGSNVRYCTSYIISPPQLMNTIVFDYSIRNKYESPFRVCSRLQLHPP